MNDKTREYPLFSACGLNCGLCPRYYTEGSSKCPGCFGNGFYEVHPKCGVLSCSQRKELEYCHLCDEFPCKKYDSADTKDSFITHRNQLRDLEKAKRIGIAAYKKELNEKVTILTDLVSNYNDGRRKNFYCIAVSLLELSDIKGIMNVINENTDVKQVVSLFEEKAKERKIELILRK